MPKRWLDRIVILLLIVLPIIFHWRVLTPNALDRGAFPAGDFAEQFYAFARFAYDELSQGRLPLWNPYTYGGHPFIADAQSAVFYPPSLIVMLVASFFGGFSLYALEWQAVLHFSLAGVFMFLFARNELRRLNTGHWTLNTGIWDLSAFLSAIVFTFGGYLTAYPSQQLAVLETDVWLPLILLFVSKSIADERRRQHGGKRSVFSFRRESHVFAGFFLGIALLAGHPQSALYVLLVSGAYAVARAVARGWRWRDIGVRLALMLVVALGVSAAQWIPSLEFMQLSSRATLTYADYARGFELQDPLQMLLPGSVSVYSPLYVGIVPLALALCALWLPPFDSAPVRYIPQGRQDKRRPQRAVIFWIGIALFALALSFGGNLFLYPILYLFAPGFALFRQQERAAFICSFALAMLAGYGALNLARALPRDAHHRLRSFARLSLGALCGAIILFVLIYFAWMAAQLNRDSPFRAASSQAAWLLLMLALLCGLLWARLQGRLKRSRLLLCLVIVTALDLFTVNWHTNFQPTPPEAQTQPPPFLEPIRADQSVFRTFNEYRIFGNFGDTFRVEDTWGASPLRLARYEQFHRLPLERVWSLLNVKYVITWRKSLGEMGVQSEVVAEEKVSDTETTYAHRLLKVSPRAALVTQVDVVSSPDAVLSRLAAPDFDFTQRAIVETPLSARIEGGESGSAVNVASLLHYRLWDVTVPNDALFVLSENFYPGWHAFVDKREMPIIRANYTMMAVLIPADVQHIEFVFDPLSVKIGAGISLLTLISLLAGWFARRSNQLAPTPPHSHTQ